MNSSQTISTSPITQTTTSTTSKTGGSTQMTTSTNVGRLVTKRTKKKAPAIKKKKSFRIQGKNLFLTYPKCSVHHGSMLMSVIKTFGDNLDWAVIAEEDHKDGTPHLHAAVALKRRIDWRSHKTLDALTGQHGNYQVARSMVKTLNYCVKGADPDRISSLGIDYVTYLEAAAAKESTKATIIAHKLEEGTIKDCKTIDAGFVLMHLRKLKEFQQWLSLEKQKEGVLSAGSYRFESRTLAHGSALVAGWLQENLFEVRDFKQKQLFLFGPPNMGKTSLMNQLRDIGVRIFYMPYEDFYDAWDDDCYDLIVLDEFKGQKRIQDLNLWLDGSHFPVRRKGCAPFIKRKNIPMIIISNYPLTGCYKVDETRLAPLKARLKCVEVVKFIEIDCVKVVSNVSSEVDTIPLDLSDVSLGSQDSSSDDELPCACTTTYRCVIHKDLFNQ